MEVRAQQEKAASEADLVPRPLRHDGCLWGLTLAFWLKTVLSFHCRASTVSKIMVNCACIQFCVH